MYLKVFLRSKSELWQDAFAEVQPMVALSCPHLVKSTTANTTIAISRPPHLSLVPIFSVYFLSAAIWANSARAVIHSDLGRQSSPSPLIRTIVSLVAPAVAHGPLAVGMPQYWSTCTLIHLLFFCKIQLSFSLIVNSDNLNCTAFY